MQSTQPAQLTTTSSKAHTSTETNGRKRPEGGLTLLNVPKKHKSHHPGQPASTFPFADQQVLCNVETPTPGAAVTYASASPDLQTASTPLAIAALTAMGMAHGNNSRPEDREEEQGSGSSRQLSLQPYDSQNEDPSGPTPGIAYKGGKILRKCTCKKSRCLKLYCECFAAGVFCDNCLCTNCCNTVEAASLVVEAKQNIVKARPSAFDPKVINATQQHSKGCNCRKSRCLKKYCECFQAGVLCTEACRCLDCHNCGPTDGHTRPPPDTITMAAPAGPQAQAGRHQADTNSGRDSTAPGPLSNLVACSVPLNVSAPSHTPICYGVCANQEAASQGRASRGCANTSIANEASLVEGCVREGSVMENLQPEQLPAEFVVSCSNPSSDAVSGRQVAVGLTPAALLPLGTIILPANHKLPPGSLVLPQGTSPGGPVCLTLPSHLSGHLPSQVPSQLQTELPASVTAVPSWVKRSPAPSPASLNSRSRHVVTHRQFHRPLSSILQQTAGPDGAGASTESRNNGGGHASQAAERVTETGPTSSIGMESGTDRLCSGLLELAEEAVSLAASESTSVQDDATSPPPFGHRAFARKAARQPFAALQLCTKQSEASPIAKAGSTLSSEKVAIMTSSSPLPAAAAKQLRSKRRKKSFLAPGKSEVVKQAAGGKTVYNVGLARTGSTTLSCNMPSRAAAAPLMGHWESPPIKGKRPLPQRLGAPEAGASMRSGRVSKLTQRFSQYKSRCSDVQGTSASPHMECDADLVDVVAALCDLGQ
ncbi:TPA: hypothetical protein ACH3X2_002000 [Trebouxia sp. C0005]